MRLPDLWFTCSFWGCNRAATRLLPSHPYSFQRRWPFCDDHGGSDA